MDSTLLLTIIGGVILLICVALAIIIRAKSNKPTVADKITAKEFLDGLSDAFYNKMIDIVNTVDITKYDSIYKLEADLLSEIYDACWTYTDQQLSEHKEEDILTAMVLRVIDKEFVIKFINELFTNKELHVKIEELWNNKFNLVSEEVIKEDDALIEEFSNPEEYVEEFNEAELEEAKDIVPTEEEIAALNPQVEIDEVEYDPETDTSVEIIEEDDVYIDKKGRKRSKSTGRYV